MMQKEGVSYSIATINKWNNSCLFNTLLGIFCNGVITETVIKSTRHNPPNQVQDEGGVHEERIQNAQHQYDEGQTPRPHR